MELTDELKEVIDEQEYEIERAVIRRGKFRFKEHYKHLEVSEAQCFEMNAEQRQAHLRKVAATPITCSGSSSSQATTTAPLALSVDLQSVAAAVFP